MTLHCGLRTLPERVSLVLLAVTLVLQSCRTATGPTLEELRNATISSLPGGPISLQEGVFEGHAFQPGSASSRRVTLWSRPLTFGELAGVRGKNAVALLSVSEGGSGSVVHVAVFQERSGRVADVGMALVGDRVEVRALSIVDGTVVLDVAAGRSRVASTSGSRMSWVPAGSWSARCR